MTKSGRGAPRAPVRGDSPPAGGVGPACRSIRGRIRASTGPLVGLALPAPPGQGGGRQPSPPLVVAGSGLTLPPWVGCRKSARPGAQKAAWNRCESSGGPGCRAPREDFRFAELPTALPGGERRLGTGRETSGGPSRSPPGPRAFCGRPAPSGQVGPHGGTSPPVCPPALRGGFQFPQPEGRRKLCACGGYPAPGQSLATFF